MKMFRIAERSLYAESLHCVSSSKWGIRSPRRTGAYFCNPPLTFRVSSMLNWKSFDSPIVQTYGPLVSSFIPIGIAVAGCRTLGMGAEKEIVNAALRCSVQLAVLALALKSILEGDKIVASLVAVSLMVFVAGRTAGDRVKLLPRSHLVATSALVIGTLSVLGMMILLQAAAITPRYIIPTAGYIIGNSMSMVGSTMQELREGILRHKGQIEAALALGATPTQAVKSYIQRAVVQGMTPWIDSIKSAGLITIPGSMTGMLMVNMRPMTAVRIQVQLLYMLLGAAALSCAISSYLGSAFLFSDHDQLVAED